MHSSDEFYDNFCASEVEVEATASRMPGGMLEESLQGLNSPDSPEAAVAKLSIQSALALRTQLAMGKPSIDQSLQDLEQQQKRFLTAAEPVLPGSKAYIYRQRMALELRFRENELLFKQQVGESEDVRSWSMPLALPVHLCPSGTPS